MLEFLTKKRDALPRFLTLVATLINSTTCSTVLYNDGLGW